MNLPRDLLARFFGKDPRVLRFFEDQAATVEATAQSVTANVAATEAMDEATVLVLSSNAAFRNERVVAAGVGIEITDDGEIVTIRIDRTGAAEVTGGFGVLLRAQGETDLVLPIAGTLATRGGVETLENKTLAAPVLSGIVNAADDAAAAGAGVPVGGIYRTGSALKVRAA